MPELKEYTFTIGGVETTLQLDDADAKRYQTLYGDQAKQAAPANKARTASDKSGGN